MVRKQKEKENIMGFLIIYKMLNEEFLAAQELAVNLRNIKKSFYELDSLVNPKIS